MNPGSVGRALACGEFEQRAQMLDVRVDPSRRDEPEQMDVDVTLARAAERGEEHVVLEERAVRNRAIDSLEILQQDAARPEREVADLRVAHLTRRKADGRSRSLEGRVGITLPQRVEYRRVGEFDCVPRPGRRQPPPVEDDQYDELQAASVPARQIA